MLASYTAVCCRVGELEVHPCPGSDIPPSHDRTFTFHLRHAHPWLQVYHPPIPGEDAGSQGAKAFTVVASEAQLQQLLPLLPKQDTVLKVGGPGQS